MADETTTNATALETGTAQGEQTQPPAGASNTPASPQTADLEKELQRVRSQMGREVAEAKRRAEAAERQAQAIAQRDREARLSQMDDVERAKFEGDEVKQYAQYLESQLRDAQNARERDAALTEISEEYGVPRDALNEATDYASAVKLARDYEKKNREKIIEEAVEKRTRKVEANAPDIGGGKPSTPASRQEETFREAARRKDGRAYILEILNGRT